MATAYIGIGSNLGDRRLTMFEALRLLIANRRVHVLDVSGLVETEPVGGPPGQGKYLNAAAMIRTKYSPQQLLVRLQRVETELGRTRLVRWGPRTIDLDLLLYDDQTIDEPELTVPHPRMHERRFVLAPLAEIAPDVVVPGTGRTVAQLLDGLAE